ncbi:MAG: metal ABC transporter substrate-binding protein [Phycisphaerae bacterium]
MIHSARGLPTSAAVSARRHAAALRCLAALLGLATSACRSADTAPTTAPAPRLRVICSFAPVYLIARPLTADVPELDVRLLAPSLHGCPHDYELSVSDAKSIAAADAVILLGPLEPFAGDAISRINPRARQIICAAGLPLIPSADADEHAHYAHELPGNPHFWLSPAAAAHAADRIVAGLAELAPAARPALADRRERFGRDLAALSREIDALRPRLAGRAVVTLHDTYAYLARDLGLTVAATLQDSPRTEPPAARIAATLKLIRDRHVGAVLCDAGSDCRLARTVAAEARVRFVELHALTDASTDPAPDEYLRRMRAILHLLAESLP